jgi:Brp/Blh family beta-carotene 15,15'-monooxygenase
MQDFATSQQIYLTVAAVMLLGMPHGALDVLMIDKLSQRLHNNKGMSLMGMRALLYVSYTLLALLCFSLWLIWPAVCLGLFLTIGALHFASDWDGLIDKPSNIFFGLAVVTMPALVYGEKVSRFFTQLNVVTWEADLIVTAMQFAFALSAAGVALIWFRAEKKTIVTLSVLSVLTAGIVLPPLLFFIAYFCALHSVLHTLSVKRDCEISWGGMFKALIVPMGGTSILLCAAYMLTPAINDLDRWMHIIFIGLFALTVPHMLLTYLHKQALRTKPL